MGRGGHMMGRAGGLGSTESQKQGQQQQHTQQLQVTASAHLQRWQCWPGRCQRRGRQRRVPKPRQRLGPMQHRRGRRQGLPRQMQALQRELLLLWLRVLRVQQAWLCRQG